MAITMVYYIDPKLPYYHQLGKILVGWNFFIFYTLSGVFTNGWPF